MRNYHFYLLLAFLFSCFQLEAQQFEAVKVKEFNFFPGIVKKATFSAKGKYLALSINNYHNALELYDANFQRVWRNSGGRRNVAGAVAITPDERFMIFSNYKEANDLAILDLRTKQVRLAEIVHHQKINELTISQDGKYLASAGQDNQLVIWEINQGRLLKTQVFRSNSGMINSIAFDANGEFLAAANTNQTVTIWMRAAKAFNAVQEIRTERNIVKKLVFSPNNQMLVMAGTDKSVHLFKRFGGRFSEVYKFMAHSHAIYDLAFSSDGKFLATASADYSVKVFTQKQDGFECQQSLWGHKSFVRQIAFNPRDNYLLSASDDRSAILWKIGSLQNTDYSSTKNEVIVSEEAYKPEKKGIERKNYGMPPILSIEEISFTEQQLDAGETAQIKIKVRNSGPGESVFPKIKLTANLPQIQFTPETVFPKIAANGGIETFVVDVKGTSHLPTSQGWIDTELIDEAFGVTLKGNRVHFRTEAQPTPEIKLAEFAVLESGSANPNNHIDLNEMIDVVFILQNIGQGNAQDLQVEVSNNQSGVLLLGHVEGTQIIRENPKLPQLASGKFSKITYRYFVNSEFNAHDLKFEINVKDAKEQVNLQKFYAVDINKDLDPLGEVWVMEGADPNYGEVSLDALPELNIDIRQNIPKTNKVNTNAIAVVIGNRDYRKSDVPSVDYALNDALLMKQYLMQSFGFREGNILFYANATQADFNSAFGTATNHQGKLFNYVKPQESDVFVFYSGHGAPDLNSQEGYFVPVDCEPSLVSLNGYSLNTFYENLSKVPYKSLTVVIDACFSGASENGMLIQNASPILIKPKNKILKDEKAIVFTSASNEQVSSWYPVKKHSMFTYFFLKGLQGAANSDVYSSLSLSEMRKYLEDNIPYMARRLHNREQNPQVYGLAEKVVMEK